MRQRVRAAMLLTAMWTTLLAAANAPPDEAIDLIVRSEVTIDRPAALVWPRLLDLASWKDSIGSLEHVAGEPNAAGELRFVKPPDGNEAAGYFVRSVKLVPGRQLVMKLFGQGGQAFVGFAAFNLNEASGRTTVVYDVYVEYRVPDLSEEERRDAAEQLYRATQTKLDQEHLKLKALVEGNATTDERRH
jgi:hypothetical protein